MLIVSPYFVPGKDGVAFFGERRREGVNVAVLTNSLAATDVWLVHAGYMKYRRPLLDEGVRLFELRPEAAGATKARASRVGSSAPSRASLHGKTFVFDRKSVFIGSVNLDPRSLEQNTEVGVVVSSPALAEEVARLFDYWASPDLSYEVTRGKNGGLQWTGGFTNEPKAGLWRPLGREILLSLAHRLVNLAETYAPLTPAAPGDRATTTDDVPPAKASDSTPSSSPRSSAASRS